MGHLNYLIGLVYSHQKRSGFAVEPLVGGKLHKQEKMQSHSTRQALRAGGMARKRMVRDANYRTILETKTEEKPQEGSV
jgi:hypothetical protein